MEIVGHQQILAYFSHGYQNKKISHAYLFSGKDGVGKRTVALHIAAMMLCEQQSGSPCGQCPTCDKLEHAVHPDVKLITPDGSTLKIEQIRTLQKECMYAPSEGLAKIFIIDDAHLMQMPAANCLLKILEEPPAYVFFFLCTSRPQQILPTITSRCQTVFFEPVPEPAIEQFLLKRGIAEQDVNTLARLCGGSVGQALWLAEEGLHARELAGTILSCVLDRDVAKMMALCEQYDNLKQEFPFVLQQLLALVRDVLVYLVATDAELLMNCDWKEQVQAWSLKSSPAALLKFARNLQAAEHKLAFHVNVRLLLEGLLIEYGA